MKKELLITRGGYRNAGLFSYVGQVIGNLHVSDERGIPMWVDIHDSPYSDSEVGKNTWDYYFKQPYGITEKDLGDYNIQLDTEWFEGKLDTITPNFTDEIVARARALTKKYIRPVDHIYKIIEDFKKQNLPKAYGSIHYRGTDHHYGTPDGTFPLIPFSYYFSYIEQLLSKFDKVLVCSDQSNFIDESIKEFGQDKIAAYNSIRSNSHLPIHYSNAGNKYKTGEDVVVESFLMSQSKYLIRTCSGVTHFSIFNAHDPEFKFVNIDEVYYGRKH